MKYWITIVNDCYGMNGMDGWIERRCAALPMHAWNNHTLYRWYDMRLTLDHQHHQFIIGKKMPYCHRFRCEMKCKNKLTKCIYLIYDFRHIISTSSTYTDKIYGFSTIYNFKLNKMPGEWECIEGMTVAKHRANDFQPTSISMQFAYLYDKIHFRFSTNCRETPSTNTTTLTIYMLVNCSLE